MLLDSYRRKLCITTHFKKYFIFKIFYSLYFIFKNMLILQSKKILIQLSDFKIRNNYVFNMNFRFPGMQNSMKKSVSVRNRNMELHY